MQISLHKNVRTTPAMRAEIAATLIGSRLSTSAQALRRSSLATGCKCRVPDDCLSPRSYALLSAREAVGELLRSLRRPS